MELSIVIIKVLLQILIIYSDTLMAEKQVLGPDCC